MRTIKFRGKRLDNGEWLYGDLMHDNAGGCYVYPIESENLFKENKVNPNTVGQFTGLLDKNEKEIYENDFVFLDNFRLVKVLYNRKRCSFEFRLSFNDGRFIDNLKDFNTDMYEIIGNVHDNPELLNSL